MPIVWLYTTENQKDNALEVIKKYTDEYQSKTPKSEGVLEYKVIIDEESEILKAISDMEDISKSWITYERADGFMGLPPKRTDIVYKMRVRTDVPQMDENLDEKSLGVIEEWKEVTSINLDSVIGDLYFSSSANHYIKATWEHYSSNVTGKSRVYLDDEPKGEIHSINNTDTWESVEETVNLGEGISPTKIQIYGYTGWGTFKCRNFKIYFEIVESGHKNIYE